MKLVSAILFTGLFVFLCIHSNGQESIPVVNSTISMSKGDQPAYIVEIPEADYESSLKNWEKLIRQNTKSKVEEIGHEIVITDTQIPEICDKPISIYSALLKGDSTLKLIALFEIDSVFFEIKESALNVEQEKTHSQIEHFLRNFAVEQYLFAVENELDLEADKLKSLNKDLEDLAKENESLLKEIKGNEQEIKNSEDAIGSYEIDNDRKQSEINNKKNAIAGINNDPELQSQAKDQLKSLEKEKKGIESKLEKEQKNVVKYNANIESLNLEVERNLALQNNTKNLIRDQELIVESVRTKLRNIK